MQPNNNFIADQFSLLSKLMEIHGENSFRSKSYSIAAYTIENLPVQLSGLPREKIFAFKGIGDATGKKIIDILETGEMSQLKEMMSNTPAGVMDMLSIKGLGPKKIAIIWKEMQIESVGELLYACNENRLALIKGFGEKTQKNVQDAIEFLQKSQGSHLYAETEAYALALDKKITAAIPAETFEMTGAFRRQLEIIHLLEWATTSSAATLKQYFDANAFTTTEADVDRIVFKGTEGIPLKFHLCTRDNLYEKLLETSSSEAFLEAFHTKRNNRRYGGVTGEADLFTALNLPFIPAFLREDPAILTRSTIPKPLQPSDIKGLIHCHSNWSDGIHSIEELADACKALHLEYLVLSDHSKSAFYARGLQEERIIAQHEYIDELNEKLAPFKIFKSIECDILSDGSMDYSNDVLASFDLVIASIHSNLKMTEVKATARLLAAIENPYTTILGHMTGRLLLSRNGYPVEYKKIIDACAANKVVIELNAHPRRLDMDWRWIGYALEKGVMISIDPDTHYIRRLGDIRYGVLSAQKAGLTKEQNLSSFSLKEFEAYLRE